MPRLRALAAVVAVLAFAAGCDDPPCGDWLQWGADPTHQSHSCVIAQRPQRLLDDIVFDPFVAQELAEAKGSLVIHYQSPLLDGDDLYMEVKSGTYLSCDPPGSG